MHHASVFLMAGVTFKIVLIPAADKTFVLFVLFFSSLSRAAGGQTVDNNQHTESVHLALKLGPWTLELRGERTTHYTTHLENKYNVNFLLFQLKCKPFQCLKT